MNRDELQAAINGAVYMGEPVYVPAGIHEIDTPLIMRRGVRLYGAGERTVIRNIRTVGERAGDTCVFLYGRYADYHEAEEWHPCADINRGDRFVVSLDDNILENAHPGEIILLQSKRRLGPRNPLTQEMNQIVGVEGNVIHLLYPISQTMGVRVGGALAAISTGRVRDRLGVYMKIVCDAQISNLCLEMAGNSWSCVHFGGMFRCSFDKVLFRGNQGIVGNGMSRCRIRDCRFECEDKCLELAYFSHHTQIIDCEILQVEGKEKNVNSSLMLTGGGHHHTIERCYVVGKSARITFCEGVRVLNSTFITTQQNAPAIRFNIGEGGLFTGNEMVVGWEAVYGAVFETKPGMIVRNNITRINAEIVAPVAAASMEQSNLSGIYTDDLSIGAIVDGNVRLS